MTSDHYFYLFLHFVIIRILRLMRLLRNRHCSSSRKISSIEYEQTNLSLLPKLYALGCEKTQLQAHMKQNLTEICPNLD